MKERIAIYDRGHKRALALMALVFCAGIVSGGSPAFGTPLSENDDSRGSGLSQPPPALTADFTLTPYRTGRADEKGGALGPRYTDFQEQPFVEKPARLMNDDPAYNKRSSLGGVAFRIFTSHLAVWLVDRFVFNYSWSHIGPTTWSHNLKTGWEWDTDRLGMNFFFHPFTGGGYFNSARANGYGFWESMPFSFAGSLTWEYFGETTLPSYNDIINTTISGAFFGEVIYRLGSFILDDRTTGAERIFREIAVALISPGRAFGRLLQGKMARVTSKEIYQKEPLNIALALGAHTFNKGTSFGTGSPSANFEIHLDYGDPYEIRPRKPFDFFKLRLDLSYGKNVGGNYLDNVVGYGLLFGKTVHSGNLDVLFGFFQHYDFWDNKIFEVGALGFGGGLVAKWQLSKNSDIQSAFHLAAVPLGASNSPYVDIVEAGVHGRNYDYSGGGLAKFEATLNLADRAQLTAIYHLYRLVTYVGPAGDKMIQIVKPRMAVKLTRNLSCGFEYLYYYKDSTLRDFPNNHKRSSEQKLYLMLYF